MTGNAVSQLPGSGSQQYTRTAVYMHTCALAYTIIIMPVLYNNDCGDHVMNSSLRLLRVPLKSKDEKTEVEPSTLKEWIIFGLLEVDPYSKPFYGNMERIKSEIEAIGTRDNR